MRIASQLRRPPRARGACARRGAGARAELPREGVQHGGAMLAHRRQRADGPAERRAEDVRAHVALARGGVRDARQPDRGLEAEGDRRGVLAIGPPRARRRAMRLRHRDQAGENRRRDPRAAARRRRASAAPARYRAMSCVVAPLWKAASSSAGRSFCTPSRRGSSERRPARSPRPARRDRGCRARSPRWLPPGSAAQAQPRLRAGQGGFGAQHRGEPRPVRKHARASARSRRADRSGRNRATKRPCPLPRRPASGATVHLRKPT